MDKYKVKSKYLKNKLKKSEFSLDEAGYLKTIAKIEEYIVNGPENDWEDMMLYSYLSQEYEEEYEELLKELRPGEVGLESEDIISQEELDEDEELQQQIKDLKKWWIANGGK